MKKSLNREGRISNRVLLIALGIFLIIVVVVVIISALSHGHGSSSNNKTSSNSLNNGPSQSQTLLDQYSKISTAGWKTFCDSNGGICFNYPPDWTLNNNSSTGLTSVELSDADNTIDVLYNYPFTLSPETTGYTPSFISSPKSDSSVSVVGGVLTATTSPEFDLVSTDSVSKYGLLIGQTGQGFPLVPVFNAKNKKYSGQFAAAQTTPVYNSVSDASGWFNSNEAAILANVVLSYRPQ